MTEQAVEVSALVFRGLFGCLTKSLLHFTDIHRCIPLCSRRLPLRQKILKAWGLRRWASFAPLGPCGRLCGGVFISVSLPLFGAPHPRHRVGQVYLCSLHVSGAVTCVGSTPANWVCRFDEDG